MASSRTSRCQICQKQQAFFICHHRRGDFCENHINPHQDPPDPHRQDVRHEDQQLQAMIDEYRVQPSQHPLLAEINRWERESIEKIQQTANEARMQFSNGINDHLARIEKALEQLKRHVDRLGKDDERLLQQWSKRVDELRTALIHPENQDGSTFISKLCLEIVEPTDLFERAIGPLRIVDRGHSIVHSQWSDHASVRGKGEYSFGQHQFRFKIEQLSADQWLFLGIVLATAPNNPVSIVTPTAYGFAGQNGLCLNGVYRNTFDEQNYESDMEMRDTVELFLDCDDRWIRLTKERTHRLSIDVHQCPFPWQFLVGLCCSVGDSLRILPRTYGNEKLDFVL